MKPLSPQTKTYLMVLIITLAGAAACWFLLGQIEKLKNDSEAVANLPFRHKADSKMPEKITNNTSINKSVFLKIGQIVQLTKEGLSLKLISVNDSRCLAESNVKCLWAGTVNATVDLLDRKTSLGIRGVGVDETVIISKYSIKLEQVSPAEKKITTKSSDYSLTFKINN